MLAAALVMLSPLTLVVLGLSHSRGYIVDAPQQYRELLDYMARTVLELRQQTPPDIPVTLLATGQTFAEVEAERLETTHATE